MRISGMFVAALGATLLSLGANAACAAVARAWVSGHGVDRAGCGAPTAPCRSLQYAQDNIVATGGEIDILDPAGYGAITITKSLSIVNDGVGTAGVQSTNGIAININAGVVDTVYLRGLNIDGVAYSGLTGVQLNTGAGLTMVNCVVRHFFNFGVALAPSDAANIDIADTISSDNKGGGILLRPPAGSLSDTYVSLDGVAANQNGLDGLSVDGSATSGQVKVLVNRSLFSSNSEDGIKLINTNDGNTRIDIVRSELLGNSAGIHFASTVGTIHLSDTYVAGNRTYDLDDDAVNTGPAGIYSYGNNVIGIMHGKLLAGLQLQ